MEEFYPSSTIQSNRYFCRGRNDEISEGFLIRSRLTLLLFVRVACCGPCVLLPKPPHQACSRANGPLVSGPPPGPESLPRHRTHLPPCSRPPSNGAYFEKWGSWIRTPYIRRLWGLLGLESLPRHRTHLRQSHRGHVRCLGFLRNLESPWAVKDALLAF